VAEVVATNQEALLRHVLSFGDRAEILAPRPLRERARKVLAALARRVS
jgi:proteasome accessory factor B